MYEKNSEIDQVNAQSTEFQKTFDLSKLIEELIEPCRAENSELSDIEILKKVLHGYHDANFSCAKLQSSLTAMQHSSNELQLAVTLPKKVFIINFSSKIRH